jgi:hypothetical protein
MHHPETATTLNNLGMLGQAQGALVEARSYFERALSIYELRLGADYPTARGIRARLSALEATQNGG